MSYLIFGARGTGSFVIEAACAELGVDYSVRDLDARAGEHRGDAYAAINPQRKMPTLRASDEVLTEVGAIVITLDERHPDGALLPPPGSAGRAKALRWMIFSLTELYPLIEMLDYPERFGPPETKDDLRERARGLWRERLAIIERAVSGPYLLEAGFCATDLVLALFVRWDVDMPPTASMPKVQGLMHAVRDRPGAGRAWARHWGR